MKEHEIRPEALLNRYLELSVRDAVTCFGGVTRLSVACVACGGTQSAYQFDKNGFAYARCTDCGTLFQNPRPPIGAFETFYRQSESSRYWAEVFFPAVAEIRREKIFGPRAERLVEMCAERCISVDNLIDVGAGYGIFLDEWRRRMPRTRLLAVEPSGSLAEECRSKGFTVVEDMVENVAGCDNSADMVTCFEVLEHVYAPLDFLEALKRIARPGGYVLVSTLCIDGFDLQMLWDKSPQISPPHHINFLSVLGFTRLFERAGMEDIVVTTPGKLDVDIVRNVARSNTSFLAGHRFLGTLLENDDTAKVFQDFLSANLRSSHAWVIGRRPNDKKVP